MINPTDAVIRIAATCVCGSDLWDYRGINPVAQPTPMGHEYAGVVQEINNFGLNELWFPLCGGADRLAGGNRVLTRRARRSGPW
jgi:NADPH:quinone reductase-like Zn-dependent oxidoreductase